MNKEQIFILLTIICCFGIISCQNSRQSQSERNTTEMNDSSQYRSKAEVLVLNLKLKGISDERILEAIGNIPRHLFVDSSWLDRAYDDHALPIDKNQTISQPYTVAFQTELLQLKTGDKVLEIGTGSGYQAAVLCEMGVEVYSIERHRQLYLDAKAMLEKLGYSPNLFYGDGYEGLPDHAPFDKILITAATRTFPEKLLDQLKVGGLMVAPIGDNAGQTMTVIRRLDENRYEEAEYGEFIFVPMVEGIEE